ncbi:MAG: hypothetical protein JXQ99_28285, partial [Hyphomicrobiaceae bacterium]
MTTRKGPDSHQSALAISGLVSALLAAHGLVALGFGSVVPIILLCLSVTVAVATIFFVAITWPISEDIEFNFSKTDLEEKIEQLEDLRWQARDNADHLQALLDGQADIIIKRDTAGKVVFANRTFCNKFSVQLEDVLRRPFHPEIVARAPVTASMGVLGADMPDWARPSIEKIETVDGARWIEWSHRWLDNTQAGAAAVHSIGRDITDQRRHERALARARDEARAADRAKSRFLASMSHEIRT